MIILLLLSFSIVIASGYLFVKVFWFDRQQIFLPLSLGFGYGLGLLSILHFVLLLLNKYHRTWVIGSELLLLSLLFAFYQYRSKKRKPYELYVMNKTAKEKPYWGLFFCLCVNLIVVFGILWLLV